MAKDNITDYSVTPSSNTDAGGVGLADGDPANNTRDATQEVMAALARTNAGTAPLDDTFRVQGSSSNTAGLDLTNVPSSTDRALDAEALYRQGASIVSVYSTSSGNPHTHTFTVGAKKFQIYGSGAGGGGGGVDGVTSAAGAGGGGSSGYNGMSLVMDIIATTATINIGAGGAGGVSSANGTQGGDTTFTDGTNAFTFGGGPGGRGTTADANGGIVNNSSSATALGALLGTCDRGQGGFSDNATPPNVRSGLGGQTPYGIGGTSIVQTGTGATPGNVAFGNGAGGSGAAARNTNSNANGGAGTDGIIIVMEW